MHRTPKRTAISLPCPPGTSDFLYLSPSHAVSPTRFLHSLSCGLQSLASARSSVSWSDFLFFFSLLPPPFQRSVVKPLLNETCCGSEKKGTTQIIFPEKVNSLSRVSKYSTGVRVSHPTVWLLTLCCGMLLMSHSSRLDWSAHFTVFPSLHPFPCWTLKPYHLKPKQPKPQTKSQVFGLFLLFVSSGTHDRGPFPQSSDFTELSGSIQITASRLEFYPEGVCLLKVVWCFRRLVI